ncbi:hypothetical protein [Paenibacillus lemnae]|uniref:Uncharacterized protein n=1 Tax=Paenibacillus lemnae TaxID=1330551 RepID=A0A848M9B4_PAELE|nr:hypothetical protein [Paenibacillus lemnae]NMO97808.1 hypothetical protein [Paenibacillus lemnae]
MQGNSKKFKQIMTAIAVIGVLGTVIPNLIDSDMPPSEKAVICTAYLIFIPLVTAAIYWVGKKMMKG